VELKKIIEEGMRKYDKKRTASDLGDRTEYVGASDVSGCMRKAVLSKRAPAKFSLATLVRFTRGHMAEKVVQNSLDAMGVKYRYQPMLEHPDKTHIKAHLDFVLTNK